MSKATKKMESQLAKLQGAEWDSDESDREQVPVVSKNAKKKANKAATAEKEAIEKETIAATNFESQVDFVELTKKTKQNLAKAKQQNDAPAKESSVIFIGRIPHGFYEKQMKGFFGQFGQIKRLRVSRNKKSGQSKHYAFIEFDDPEVASVVASTMDGYRLFDRVLSCSVVPVEKLHDRMFIGANRKFRPMPYKKIAIRQHNAPKSFEQQEAVNSRLIAKENKKRAKLANLGIEYDFKGYAGCAPAKANHVKITQVIVRRDEIGLVFLEDPEEAFVLEDHKLGIALDVLPTLHKQGKEAFFASRTENDTQRIIQASRAILLVCADYYTAWNARKKLLVQGHLDMLEEFKFMNLVLSHHSKSIDTWAHRRWMLDRFIPLSKDAEFLQKELALCLRLTELYPRNYHAWSYRYRICCYLAHDELVKEFDANQLWCERHVADHSGWNHRQLLLNLLLPSSGQSLLLQEFAFHSALLKVYFDREALWCYRRALLHAYIETNEESHNVWTIEMNAKCPSNILNEQVISATEFTAPNSTSQLVVNEIAMAASSSLRSGFGIRYILYALEITYEATIRDLKQRLHDAHCAMLRSQTESHRAQRCRKEQTQETPPSAIIIQQEISICIEEIREEIQGRMAHALNKTVARLNTLQLTLGTIERKHANTIQSLENSIENLQAQVENQPSQKDLQLQQLANQTLEEEIMRLRKINKDIKAPVFPQPSHEAVHRTMQRDKLLHRLIIQSTTIGDEVLDTLVLSDEDKTIPIDDNILRQKVGFICIDLVVDIGNILQTSQVSEIKHRITKLSRSALALPQLMQFASRVHDLLVNVSLSDDTYKETIDKVNLKLLEKRLRSFIREYRSIRLTLEPPGRIIHEHITKILHVLNLTNVNEIIPIITKLQSTIAQQREFISKLQNLLGMNSNATFNDIFDVLTSYFNSIGLVGQYPILKETIQIEVDTIEFTMSCGSQGIVVFTLGLITGTGTTLMSKIMYNIDAVGLDGTRKKFEKPIFQTWLMFAAMVFALPIQYAYHLYLERQWYANGGKINGFKRPNRVPIKTYFILALPAAFDLIATYLANLGLLYVTVSVFQLLKCTVIVFVALLKVLVLKDRLRGYMWIGIGLNTAAAVMVGFTSFQDAEEQLNSSNHPGLGVLLIVSSCFVQSAQYVFEEKLMGDGVDTAPPLIVVGMEGFWGIIMTSLIVYPIAYTLPGNDLGSYERFDDATKMLANSSSAQIAACIFVIVILGYNVFAVFVTFLLNSIWHAILDNFRPITVWSTDLLLFYVFTPHKFGEAWTIWSWLELGGMVTLLIGTAVYNGTIQLPGHYYEEVVEEVAGTTIRTPVTMMSSTLSRSPMITKTAIKAADIARRTPDPMDRERVRKEYMTEFHKNDPSSASKRLDPAGHSYGSMDI
ncbi:Drug/Metabolite Transporter (DMT) Superfamily [Thraustotheca clavata]|uniref:Drug/Metabolite Transporter (DMT) Superfamily n=1 Tax=Thraustotheca clavata TaxID=74557 RepID=A0A1V9Y8M9_9STRA|nr:Drug/Metabolite Transporter (DMT) Superfamily [Thraustotheca clavata]